MSTAAVVLVCAAFAQVLLTFWAIWRMGMARVAVIRSGALRIADIALDSTVWPEHIRKLQANTSNQFETPILFFAGIAIALGSGAATPWVALFAWLYVASRLAHRRIHVGTNDVTARFRAYLMGLFALMAMWVALMAAVLMP